MKAGTACSEKGMQLRQGETAILEIALGNAVVTPCSHAYLHELDRDVLPHSAVAGLFVLIDVVIGIEILGRDFQIVALAKIPVGLKQSHPLAAFSLSNVRIDHVVHFRQPHDGTRAQTGEHILHLAVPDGGIIEIETCARAPASTHMFRAQTPLLAVVRFGSAGSAIAHGELRA